MRAATKLQPAREFRIYKRNLPHWELPGGVYFVTFRTAEGFILSDQAKEIVFETIKFHDSKKYELHACVVMETHVHIIMQPLQKSNGTFYSLAQVMHSLKSYSANRIQRLLHRDGKVWLDENYDRIIRGDKEFEDTLSYIINNPLKAGLAEKPEDYKWLHNEGSE